MTEKLISICGLNCATCPAFTAYKTDNNHLRQETAEKWAKYYPNSALKPEDINCTGCLSDGGIQFIHCVECGVRKCGQVKGVKNCGECSQYLCAKIESLHQTIPDGKPVCDEEHGRH